METDPNRCGVPWPVCPDCEGEGLTWTRDVVTCRRCGGTWRYPARVPCPDRVAVVLRNPDGTGELRVCRSHAAHTSARLLMKVQRTSEGGDAC